jgi:hypothetical protein
MAPSQAPQAVGTRGLQLHQPRLRARRSSRTPSLATP